VFFDNTDHYAALTLLLKESYT